MKKLVGALLLSAGLILGGCAAPVAEDPSANIEINVDDVRNGTPEISGWVDKVVQTVQKNKRESGVLVEATGMITKGSDTGTVSNLTIVDPMALNIDDDEESSMSSPDAVEEIPIPANAAHADVYFASPIEMTRWTHLTSVRGMAFADPNNPNKIIIRGAIEVD